jgi:hypothetical protein
MLSVKAIELKFRKRPAVGIEGAVSSIVKIQLIPPRF